MLYNILTGYGIPAKPQHEIVYICCNLGEIAASDLQWCYTDGNAAKTITRFYSNLKDLSKLDWHSIQTSDFRDDNADGDPDRKRKKHAEFLIKNHVPVNYIAGIAVFNEKRYNFVKDIVEKYGSVSV